MRAHARFLSKETRRTDTRIAATRPHQKAPTKNTRPTPSIHPTSVTLVTTLQQLQQLHLDLLAPPLPSQPHPWTRAVALDCEWQPFHNRATKTPVSLLQVADDAGRVWLLDLLALLCPLPNLLCTPWALQGGNGLCWPRDPTEEEAALAALLHQLLTRDDIIKVCTKPSVVCLHNRLGMCAWSSAVCVHADRDLYTTTVPRTRSDFAFKSMPFASWRVTPCCLLAGGLMPRATRTHPHPLLHSKWRQSTKVRRCDALAALVLQTPGRVVMWWQSHVAAHSMRVCLPTCHWVPARIAQRMRCI